METQIVHVDIMVRLAKVLKNYEINPKIKAKRRNNLSVVKHSLYMHRIIR